MADKPITNIPRECIEKAFEYIDKNGYPKRRESTGYNVIYNDKHYPIKYVTCIASHLHYGTAITDDPYSPKKSKDYLEKLGFSVRDKRKVANKEEKSSMSYKNQYSEKLIRSKNIIFRGAPGTGKSYLAKQIAADIVSQGKTSNYDELSKEQKQQIEFVQFHPSYDYSDFVEGLRPKINNDGTMGFELKQGIFTQFIAKAQKNIDDSRKTLEAIAKESSIQDTIKNYFDNIEFENHELKTVRENRFYITNFNENNIDIFIPDNPIFKEIKLNTNELIEMLKAEQTFHQVKDVTKFFNKSNATQQYSYNLAIYTDIKSKKYSKQTTKSQQIQEKPYIFIIDEINRGEISKIFGELFFAIDPGYRGKTGEVSTQYANLHQNPEQKFSIPENVYIIGTMNDIDRSVDSFDFAMRRRFRFIEIKAESQLSILASLEKDNKDNAIARMKNLNNCISSIEGLNENYHIGPAYFLKLDKLSTEELWSDYLEPLLQDYIRGMNGEKEIIKELYNAYSLSEKIGDINADSEN